MTHCPPRLLDDLDDVFAEIRTWNGVVEKSGGVFYVGSQPFLHFHLFDGVRRRADVKGRAEWTQLELPRPVSRSARQALLRALRIRYREKRGETGAE